MAPDIDNVHKITTSIGRDHALPDQIPESHETHAQGPSASLFSLQNHTILITGGGRGVGLTQAIGCAEAGAHVACVDILPEPTAEQWPLLQAAAKKAGTTATYYRGDITSEQSMADVFKTVSERAQTTGAPLRGVIACAGIQQMTPVLDYPAADFDRMMRVNATGTFVTAKLAAKTMMENGVQGSIVLIASISGRVANRGLTCSAYNTSKGAVLQLCRSMAQEIGVHGIRINCISPGYIRTAMTDQLLTAKPEVEQTWMAGALLNRLGAPEDFKAPAVFLLSPGSSWMTGSDLTVDGGQTASA